MLKTLKTISAYEARKNFGELMNLAYYNNYEIIVKKMGRPMIKIIKITTSIDKVPSRSKIMAKYSGIWNTNETKEVEKSAKSFRKIFKLLK